MSDTKFPLGHIVATPGALSEIERLTGNSSQTLTQLLSRHASGDWGAHLGCGLDRFYADSDLADRFSEIIPHPLEHL